MIKRSNRFAQTNVQLFNQLRSENYSKQEVMLVWKTYEFGMLIFSGLYLPSGRPFLDHLVGTASILAWLRMPIEIVAAGLIHAAYLHGDFGIAARGVSLAKREQVKNIVGDRIEEYVLGYDRLTWNPETLQRLGDDLDSLSRFDREILLIRLCNELEHNLDLDALYFAGNQKWQAGHQRVIARDRTIISEIAEKLGLPSLAAEMHSVMGESVIAELPIEPRIRSRHTMAYLVDAKSYQERFAILFERKAVVGLTKAYKLLEMVKDWLRKLRG